MPNSPQTWNGKAKLVLAWGIVVLLISGVGLLSNFRRLNQWTPGVLLTYHLHYQCAWVNVLTPPSWPGLASGALKSNDCIDQVDDLPTNTVADYTRLSAYIARKAAEHPFATLEITGRRHDEPFTARVQPMQITLYRLLDQMLPPLLSGLALWILGLVVLWAQPQSESNRVWAAFLFMGELVLAGAMHSLPLYVPGLTYDAVVIMGPRPFLGALLFHLAFLYPQPVRPSWQRWRIALYPIAVIDFLLLCLYHWNLYRPLPHISFLEQEEITARIILPVFGLGAFVLLLRSAWVGLRSPAPRYRFQTLTMLIAWIMALPISFFEMILNSLHLPWMAHTSNQTFIFWVVPATALIAYGMIRYQAFSYHGTALRTLAIFFTAALFTGVIALFLTPLGIDGVQLTVLLSTILLVTYLWLGNTPLHRLAHRIFLRHDYDYEVVDRFTQQTASSKDLESCLRTGVQNLCQLLEVSWAAVRLVEQPHKLYFMQAGASEPAVLTINTNDVGRTLPGPAAADEELNLYEQHLGRVWVGERLTAEPFDEFDGKLLGLLATAWSQALAVRQQLAAMARTPGRVLEAVESERKRIGQDLHDGVLQFLGTIPIDLDRATALLSDQNERASQILQRHAKQAQIIANETRAIVYDLYPPSLAEGGLLAQVRQFADRGCQLYGAELHWEVQGAAANDLPAEKAIHLYRIIQQALTNAWQHAKAQHIWVQFSEEYGHLLVVIRDDGRGFDLAAVQGNHLGLLTMRERARLLLANLQINSTPGAGTSIGIALPLSGKA